MEHATNAAIRSTALAALLALASHQAAADVPGREQILAAAFEVMTAARYCSFVTVGLDGHPQARVVDPLVGPDRTLWVATNPRSRKVSEIKRDSRVTMLCFNAPANEYVTLRGRAKPVADAATRQRRFKPEWEPFYKGGATGADLMLYEVRPTRFEVSSARLGMANDPDTWRPVVLDLRVPAAATREETK